MRATLLNATVIAACLVLLPTSAATAADAPVTVSSLVRSGTDVRVVSTTVPASQASSAVRQMEAQTGTTATVEHPIRALDVSNDPYRYSQWGLNAADFESAWTTANGSGITVAVIDTGVDSTHPDLAGQVLAGKDFTGTGSANSDVHGHGTHVAGIIAAIAGNSTGITGAAPGVRILPIKVLDSSGYGWDADLAAGIIYAADNGAKIVNLSLGGEYDILVDQAVAYAASRGVLVVAAAGNSGEEGNAVSYPAAYDTVLAVAATTSSGGVASYSTKGSYVDIAAPGDGIWSTWRGRSYGALSGTSMAAPFAAAEAALVWSANPGWSSGQVRDRMLSSAQDLGTTGVDPESGAGLIRPLAAVCTTCATPTPTPAPTPTPGPVPAPTPVPRPTPTRPVPTLPTLPSPVKPDPTQPVPTIPPTAPVVTIPEVSILSNAQYSTPGQKVRFRVRVTAAGSPVPGALVTLTSEDGASFKARTGGKGKATFFVKPKVTTKYTAIVSSTTVSSASSGGVTAWVVPELRVTYKGRKITWTLNPAQGQMVTVLDVSAATPVIVSRVKVTGSGTVSGSVRVNGPGKYKVEVSPATRMLPVASSALSLP